MATSQKPLGVESSPSTRSMTKNGYPAGATTGGASQHPVKTEEDVLQQGGAVAPASAVPEPGPNGIEAIRARHGAATPGPYRWRGYATSHQISLDSRATGDEVLAFRRWGMQRAQPVFGTKGLLYPASELLKPDTAPDRRRITAILHPDAEFLAHSWEDVRDLLAEVDRLKAEATRAAAELRHAYGNNAQGHGHDPELVARAIRILEAAVSAEVRHG